MLDTAKGFAMGILIAILFTSPRHSGGGMNRQEAILVAFTVLPVLIWDLWINRDKEGDK